jgi:hypothetical protein
MIKNNRKHKKVVFIFTASDELYRELANYNSGALVKASRLAAAIKNLKIQTLEITNIEKTSLNITIQAGATLNLTIGESKIQTIWDKIKESIKIAGTLTFILMSIAKLLLGII